MPDPSRPLIHCFSTGLRDLVHQYRRLRPALAQSSTSSSLTRRPISASSTLSRQLINTSTPALHSRPVNISDASRDCPSRLASTMTNHKKHGSKKEPIKYIDVCEECYNMERRIDHIEARGSKFCPKRALAFMHRL